MNEHRSAAGASPFLTIVSLEAHPSCGALLLRFKLNNPTGRSRRLTVIADASDARGSFVVSASRTLAVQRRSCLEGTLLLEADPACTLCLSLRDDGYTLHTLRVPAPLIPFNPEKEELP